jgi:lysine biosynthesis protein LysW
MNEQVKTQGGKFACTECRNEITLDPSKVVGDVVECPYCGIEYEVTSKEEQESVLQMIEEEK